MDGYHFPSATRLCLALLLMAAGGALAQDLGQIGPVHPVAEPDMLEQIERRLQRLKDSGALATMQRDQATRATQRIQRPPTLPGLGTAPTSRTHYVDPSFTLDRTVRDAQGKVLFPIGSRRNPLEVVTWQRKLLFFDASDSRQRAVAEILRTRHGEALRAVLVGGSYLDLIRQWGVAVFYDQNGELVKRFGITQVPAMVYQEGMRLRVDAIGVQP